MLDPAARRLLVAAVLRLHLAQRLGAGPLPADLDDDGLRAAGARLAADADLERRHGLGFDPAYPGASDGVETVRGGRRLVLTCRATHRGEPAAVVVTTLVPGREPLVSAAPPAMASG